MEAAGPEAPRSCLLVNTALEQARLDAGVRRRVKQHFDSIEALLRDALETAARAGELPPEKDPASLAAFLMSSIWGLRVLGATQAPPERANRIVDQVLSTLDPAR
jgi:TetR/AcrR family transcriptional repressor of nem operon